MRAGLSLVTAAILPIMAQAEAPRVVADIAPVHALVAQVMKGVGTPDLLMPPTASPHGYSMRPSEARAFQEADILVWIGPELSPVLERQMAALAGDAKDLELLEVPGTVLLDGRSLAVFADDDDHDHDDDHGDHDDHADHDDHDHDKDEEHAAHDDHDHDDHKDDDHSEHDDHDHDEHKDEDHADHDDHDHDDHKDDDHAEHDDHDHDEEHADADGHDDHDDHKDDHEDHAGHGHDDHHGHDHDGVDPHAWLDPQNASIWVGAIAEALAAEDPDNASTYRANAAKAQADLAQLTASLYEKLAPVSDDAMLVYHDAYQYFDARFGLNIIGAIAPGDATSPSAGRVAELRDAASEQNVACLFAEPQYSTSIVNALRDAADIETASLDPIGVDLTPGPDQYAALLTNLAHNIVECVEHGHDH